MYNVRMYIGQCALYGTLIVIRLRKFIQSSTVDLCRPMGAKIFFFSFKRKRYFTNGKIKYWEP